MLNGAILTSANEVVNPGFIEIPLRLVDLAWGLPVAILGATVALCVGALLMRVPRLDQH
jgi:hypothetical protein